MFKKYFVRHYYLSYAGVNAKLTKVFNFQVKLNNMRRSVLVNYDSENKTVDIRH